MADQGASDREITGGSPVSTASPVQSDPATSGEMSRDTFVKVCAWVSLIYLSLLLYFLSALHGWDVFTELPTKVTRDIRGHVAGFFGTPICALIFLAIAYLMCEWNKRLSPFERTLWNRFPVPLHIELPATDPVGRTYRVVFFVLVFGLGIYVQGDLFRSFYTGVVYLDSPNSEDIQAQDPRVLERQSSPDGIVIRGFSEHYTHRPTGLIGNNYHFEQDHGLTYFPGYQPYLYLALVAAMFSSWLRSVWPWVTGLWRRPVPTRIRTDSARSTKQTNTVSKSSRELTGKVLKYVEVDERTGTPTGRSASFLGAEIQPLQYSDLVDQKLGNKVVVPLNWRSARVVESTIPEIAADTAASGESTLESIYSSKTIGLVKGGWLPAGLALEDDMIVLPDRCTVSELEARFREGIKRNNRNNDFLDLFADQRIRINPLLFALEGNLRVNPTPEVVEKQLKEAQTKIKSALPLAELVPDKKGGAQGVIGIIRDTQAGMACKQDFLVRLAPKLRAPVSVSRRSQLWNEVLATAEECDVPKRSLVVVAALSALVVPNGKSPAKGLLKLAAPNYSTPEAYNALADLRSLEVLMCLFALFPNERMLLCTGDKGLALFWTGIRPSEFAWRNNHLHFKVSPIEALLPNLTPEQRSSYFDEKEDSTC